MSPASSALASLLALWESDAAALERRGDDRGAALLRQCVTESRTALAAAAAETLTLAAAEQESGIPAETLRKQVAAGRIPNAGRKGAPLIRRADLPHRPRLKGSSEYNPAADALALVSRLPRGA